jgi:hypothetical protein
MHWSFKPAGVLWRAYYVNIDSVYVKFVGYDVNGSNHLHFWNCFLRDSISYTICRHSSYQSPHHISHVLLPIVHYLLQSERKLGIFSLYFAFYKRIALTKFAYFPKMGFVVDNLPLGQDLFEYFGWWNEKFISPTAPYSSVIWGWYNSRISGRHTKWNQYHPHPARGGG